MKKLLMIFAAFLLIQPTYAKIENPQGDGDGYNNVNDRKEYQYGPYPGELIWHEFGRPFWRGGNIKTTARIMDGDRDGIADDLDQCPNTPRNTEINAFGCNKGEDIKINLGVKFASGKAIINEDYTEQVDKLGKIMTKHRNLRVEIQGHTDNTGKRSYNVFISKKRSMAVRSYLIENYNIDPDRLVAKGFGPDSPVEDNGTNEGRRKNRRVEGKIISQ